MSQSFLNLYNVRNGLTFDKPMGYAQVKSTSTLTKEDVKTIAKEVVKEFKVLSGNKRISESLTVLLAELKEQERTRYRTNNYPSCPNNKATLDTNTQTNLNDWYNSNQSSIITHSVIDDYDSFVEGFNTKVRRVETSSSESADISPRKIVLDISSFRNHEPDNYASGSYLYNVIDRLMDMRYYVTNWKSV